MCSYIITDYDQKNFTVAQALFDDKAEPNIIPIPWNATVTPSSSPHLNRGARIGIGIGSAVFFLLLVTSVFFAIRRWRRHRTMTALANQKLQDSPIVRPFSSISTHEMDQPCVRELHDNPLDHQELLDANTPSGSGIGISELANEGATSLHELVGSHMYGGHELSSDSRSESSAKPSGFGKESYTPCENDTRNSNTPNLTPSPKSSESISPTKNSWKDHVPAAPRNLPQSLSRLEINKPLPRVPRA